MLKFEIEGRKIAVIKNIYQIMYTENIFCSIPTLQPSASFFRQNATNFDTRNELQIL